MISGAGAVGLPLAGLRVIDAAGATAPHCGLFLSLFGANVVVLRSNDERTDDSLTRDGIEWTSYNLGKQIVPVGADRSSWEHSIELLSPHADVLIDGDVLIDPDAIRARSKNETLIHATVTPFGLDGPRASWFSTEMIGQASGGILYLSGHSDLPPATIGMPLAKSMAGAQAACAVMLAVAQRQHTGFGARIDVSQQEAVANLLFVAQFLAHVLNDSAKRGEAALTSSEKKLTRKVLWECADGWVTWTLWTGPGMGPKNRETFEWMRERGIPEAEELLSVPWPKMSTEDLTAELLEKVNGSVGAMFASLTKEEINREAFARRILLYAVQSPSEVVHNAQLRARDAFRSFELPDRERVEIVATPARSTAYELVLSTAPESERQTTVDEVVEAWSLVKASHALNGPSASNGVSASGAPRAQASRTAALPLAGVRVLDLGWAVVSPLTTKYLALFGAEVIKLEYRKRPDPTRMTGPYPLGKPAMDGSAAFVSINASKRSVGIDLNNPMARSLVHRLAARADIVCENFAPGVASRMGYGYEQLRAVKPDLIMCSLSMQGQSGPRAEQPGLGNHLQAMSGIDDLTGFSDGPPGGPNQVMPDYIGPWLPIVSLLAALEHRRKTGEGQYLDVSQLEAIFLFLQPRLIEAQHVGSTKSVVRHGNSSPTMSPHGIYPVAGRDQWVAIAVQSDTQWQRLHALLPSDVRRRFAAGLTTDERIRNSAQLDAALAQWTVTFDGNALAEQLQSCEVAAYTVNTGPRMLADPQLLHRGHYHHVDHSKLGDLIVDLPSFRISSITPRVEPGPMYADDTVAVLQEWLDIDGDELAALVEAKALDF